MSIRIGIAGYGNLGRGAEAALRQNPDMRLAAVFTRRDIQPADKNTPVVPLVRAAEWKDKIDVMILCGGSASDLPEQTPMFAQWFNVVDSFDTHAKIPAHFGAVDAACRAAGTVGIISVGWDPGLFSLNRLYAQAVLPEGKDYTFWGKGVSQGHTRECFVVLEKGADASRVERDIKMMPDYFADYDTTVHFISQEELQTRHAGIPHGGFVLRSGVTGGGANKHLIEYRLKLDSNPQFTAGVLAAYARAAWRFKQAGQTGCRTVFDVPPAYLSPKTGEELRASLL